MNNIPSMKDLGLDELDNKDKALYLMWESSNARSERTNIRQWIIILVLIIALIGTNAFWIYRDSQYVDVVTTTETITQEATSDGDSDINLQNIRGDFYGGENKTDSNQNNN